MIKTTLSKETTVKAVETYELISILRQNNSNDITLSNEVVTNVLYVLREVLINRKEE